MKQPNWKSLVEIVGISAIVASLIFVGLEMRQSREIAMSDGALANAANEIERHLAISENSDIWLKGNAGAELSESEMLQFQGLVQIVDAAEFMEIARLRRVGADDIADSLTADFSVFLYENPGARRIWTDIVQSRKNYRSLLAPNKEIIDDVFADTVISHLTKLDQLQE